MSSESDQSKDQVADQVTDRVTDQVTAADTEEELVAYLDGELDAEEIDRIERRLATDPDYHRQLVKLQQAWDMLEQLPRAHATESFTNSTVELVAVSLASEARQKHWRWRARMASVLAVVLLFGLITGAAGYFGTQWLLDEPNRQFARDLPVIDNVDRYRNADSIKFLERLAEEGMFDEEPVQE